MMVAIAAALAAVCAWLLTRSGGGSAAPRLRWRDLADRARSRWRFARRRRSRFRAAVRDLLAEICADVRAGQPPARAVERALMDGQESLAPRTLAAVRWGGDVAGAMRADGDAHGVPLLRSAAACWVVAHDHGAGLADALERLVAAERRAEEVRRQLEAHLAAPRATARMLAFLPLLGLALGFAIGGDPLAWLIGGPAGWACLVVGLALTGLGLAWTGRIAARTEALL